MRVFYFLLLFVLTGLGFYLGYEVGTSQQSVEIVEVEVPAEPEVIIQKVEVPVEPVVIVEEVEVAEETPVVLPTEEEMSARAAQRIITLTDGQGRSLAVEIMEVRSDAIKVRRRADLRIVDIPLVMLSEVDRAFAEFLGRRSAEQRGGAAARPQEMSSEQQRIFDQIFGR